MMKIGLGVPAPRPEMMAAVQPCSWNTLQETGAVVMMKQQAERRTYPHNSPNSKRGAANVVAPDNSATSESMNIGDSAETTQDANRFSEVRSGTPEVEAVAMPNAKDITRSVFSSWVERRLQILKEWRVQSQNTDGAQGTSPAIPPTSTEHRQANQMRRQAK